jgi:hypothetical protein
MTKLTNGFLQLERIDSVPVRFLIATSLLGFGGFCVMLQTKSVIGDLPMGPFLTGKLMQTAFSLLYSLNWLVLIEKSMFFSPILILAADLIVACLLVLNPVIPKIIVAFRCNMLYNRSNVQK